MIQLALPPLYGKRGVSPMNNPQRFLITNSVALNGGDAAILLAMIDSLKKEFGHDIKILVQAKKHKACARYYPEINFMPGLEQKEKGKNLLEKIFLRLKYPRILLFLLLDKFLKIRPTALLTEIERTVIDSFRENEIIISCGGGFLNDYYPLYSRTLGFFIAHFYGRPFFIYAQSVGPFWKNTSRKQARWILDHAGSVTLRDERSLKIAKEELKISNKNVFFTADEALLLPSRTPVENEVSKIRKKYPEKLLVGISVRKWGFEDIPDRVERIRLSNKYERGIMDICIHLVEKYDAIIVFISTCQGRGEYFIDDSLYAGDIIKPMPYNVRERIHISEEAYDPRELKEIMKNFYIFIGVRMHTIVLAASSAVPCIGLGYEFKTEELFRQLEIKDYAIDLKSEGIEKINDIVDDLIEKREEISSLLKSRIGGLEEKASQNIKILSRAIRNISR